MRDTKTKTLVGRLLRGAAAAFVLLLAVNAQAAVPGITGPTFNLRAEPAYISKPDGTSIYSWGYGCNVAPAGFAPTGISGSCDPMQIPGPTLIVTEGQRVTVNLTNNLPGAAGNTSILFPGFDVCAGTFSGGVCTPGGVQGLLTREAAPGGIVTYSFDTTGKAGTRAYYSGTQGDLQIEMGLYGAIIVLPATVPPNCASGTPNDQAKAANLEVDFRLAAAAYNHSATCYDREYLFQFSEIDPRIHRQAEE